MLKPQLSRAKEAATNATKSRYLKWGESCYICQKDLFMAFFFDSEGHDARKEVRTEKLSNISRLYWGFPHKQEERGLYPWYAPGLGTKFKPGLQTNEALARASSAADAKGIARKIGIEAGFGVGEAAAERYGIEKMKGAARGALGQAPSSLEKSFLTLSCPHCKKPFKTIMSA